MNSNSLREFNSRSGVRNPDTKKKKKSSNKIRVHLNPSFDTFHEEDEGMKQLFIVEIQGSEA